MTAHNPDTREKLLEFAERCEAATAPDFALDCDIARAMGYCVPDLPTGSIPSPVPSPIWRYTASLDAAMTLVPKGWDWLVRNDVDEKFAHVTRDYQSVCEVSGGEWIDRSTGSSARAYAATPALALCAAALRARNEQVAK